MSAPTSEQPLPLAKRWRRLAVVALVPVLVLVGVVLVRANGQSADQSPHGTSPLIGHRAPALSGTTVSGGHYAYHPGAVTVVNIWASWCSPCRSELPTLVRLARQWAGQSVQVATIDTRDGATLAAQFLRQTGGTGLTAVRDPNGVLAVAWGATGVPETFVVDADGIVRAHWNGAVDATWLSREVAEARKPLS